MKGFERAIGIGIGLVGGSEDDSASRPREIGIPPSRDETRGIDKWDCGVDRQGAQKD